MMIQVKTEADGRVEQPAELENVRYQHADYDEALAEEGGQAPAAGETFERPGVKIGRNDPCPCGSGKKYKQCHGKLA